MDDFADDAGFPASGNLLFAAIEEIVQMAMVQAKKVEQRGLKIVGRNDVGHGAMAEFISFAISSARPEATASHPHAEALAVVITA